MRLPGLKYLRQSGCWLRSRIVPGVLILGYHRIAAVSNDAFDLCVAPQHFAQQLEILHRYTQPLSLPEMILNLRDRRFPKRAIVLTFDDGYADILYQAKPLLERYQIPATVFVTTGYMEREFWWNKLERILLLPQMLPDDLCLNVNRKNFTWTLETANKPASK